MRSTAAPSRTRVSPRSWFAALAAIATRARRREPRAGAELASPRARHVCFTFESVLSLPPGDGVEDATQFQFGVAVRAGDSAYTFQSSGANLVRLHDGETFVLTHPRTFRIRSECGAPVEFALSATGWDDECAHLGALERDGRDVFMRVVVDHDVRTHGLGLRSVRVGRRQALVDFHLRVTSTPAA